MSAHTPGPWICEASYGNHGLRIDAEHGVALGHVRAFIPSGKIRHGSEVQMRWEEGFANARLIAAAPEYHDAAFWIRQAVANNAAPVNPLAALEEMALNGEHITLDAGLVLDLLKAHAKAGGAA